MNLEPGSIIGDYQVIGVLGAGGMGKVYKVRNTISDRVEAMKVLLPDLLQEADLADRFLREIKVQASLEHPNIASLRTALRHENQLLMVMELVEGITLEERLHQSKLSPAEAVDYIGQVLSALSYAHTHGVIHRDIKPANMMLTAGGVVKLMDFGIAKAAADRKLTMTGTTMGSLYYMSPEQIRGEDTLDPRSDLYSVGVSLYELVTGKRPFDGDSQFAIMSAHLEKAPPPPVSIDPSLPEALNEIIMLGVAREPAGRFQTAEAFGNALASVKADLAPAAPRAAPLAAPPPAPIPTVAAPVAVAAQAPPRAAPLAPPPAARAEQKSKRWLWATVGALCVVGALVAMVQFGPWKKAAADAAPAQVTTPAVPPPAEAQPAAPVQTATPAENPAAAPATQPSNVSSPAATAAAPAPVKPRTATVSSPVRASPSAAAPAPMPVQPARQQPAVQAAPAQQPAAAAPQQPDPSAAQAAALRAELQKARISLVTLNARAASVHTTLDNIRRRQEASGLGMRGDWAQAASLMDTFLGGAGEAINANDPAAAKDFMDKAERQLEKLEAGLNK